MRNKIAALVVALMASIGMVAVAAPVAAAPKTIPAETQAQMANDGMSCVYVANDDNTIASKTCVPESVKKAELARWGYCSYTPSIDQLTFWDNQGYCGDSVNMNRPALGQCRYMGVWDNWAGSMTNYVTVTGYNTVLWQGTCGSSLFLNTGYGANKPDLYDSSIGLGNAITNISR